MHIGLVGYATAGKSEVARILNEKYGYTRYSFSDPLCEALLAIDPWIPEDDSWLVSAWPLNNLAKLSNIVRDYGWTKTKTIPEVRRLLQKLGTEAGRDIHGQDCWVYIADEKVGHLHNVVFENVRFDNEVDYVRDNGGTIWRVLREGVGPVNGHRSDMIDEIVYDLQIDNSGTVEELEESVDTAMQEMLAQ